MQRYSEEPRKTSGSRMNYGQASYSHLIPVNVTAQEEIDRGAQQVHENQ